VAAGVEVVRALTLRAHRLHPADTTSGRAALVSMVSAYAMTVAAVLFLVWLHRCRHNARVITPGADLGSDVWAVAAWLIPLVNAWFPRGLLLATLRASGGETAGQERAGVLVNAWWVAWAGHLVIAAIGLSGTSLAVLVISQALNLTAAALVIVVIHRITAMQTHALTAPRVDVMPAV
jgi:hypothetical protein